MPFVALEIIESEECVCSELMQTGFSSLSLTF